MGFLKDLFTDIGGTVKAVVADAINLMRDNPEHRIREVEFGGRRFKTPSFRAEQAGRLFRQKKYKEAGGELLWAGLDILSMLPAGRGIKTGIKATELAGKELAEAGAKRLARKTLAKDVLKTSALTGAWSAGYSASDVMQRGGSWDDVVKQTFRGAGLGFTAGLGFGSAAAVLGHVLGRSKKHLFKTATELAEETNPRKIYKTLVKEGFEKKDATHLSKLLPEIKDESVAYNTLLSGKAFKTVKELTGKEPPKEIKTRMSTAISQFTKHSDDVLEHQIMTARLVNDVARGAVEKLPEAREHYKKVVTDLQKVAQKKKSLIKDVSEERRRRFLKKAVLDYYKRKKKDLLHSVARKYKSKEAFLSFAEKEFKVPKEEAESIWKIRNTRPNKFERNRRAITRKIHQYARTQLPTREADKILARLKSSEATTLKGFSRIIDDIGKMKVKVKRRKLLERKMRLVEQIKNKYVHRSDKKRVITFKRLPEKIATKLEKLKNKLNKTSNVDERLKIAKKIKEIVEPLEERYLKAKKVRSKIIASEKATINRGVPADTVRRAREIFGLDKDFYERAIKGEKFKVKEYQDFLRKLKKGDRFLTKENINALTAKGSLGESIIDIPKDKLAKTPISELAKKYKLTDLMGVEGQLTTKFRKAMSQIVNVKKLHPLVKKFLDSIQADEVDFTRRLIKEEKKLDKIHKLWKKKTSLFQKRKSLERIFNAWEGKDVKLNKTEKETLDFFKSYMKEAEEYLKRTRPNFHARKNYAPHIKQRFNEYIRKYGWKKGVRYFMEDKKMMKALNGERNALLFLHNNISDEYKAGFLKERKGTLRHSTDPFNAFEAYMKEFERVKYMDKVLPKFTAFKKLVDKTDGFFAWLEQHKANLKGKAKTDLDKALLRIADLNYMTKLSVSPISATKNMIGGNVNNIIENGLLTWVKGGERIARYPRKLYRYYIDNGLDVGHYTEAGKNVPIHNKALRKSKEALFLNQSLAEAQIRLQQFAGLLNKEDWKRFKAGKPLSPKRLVEIADNLEKTQGIYTSSRTAHGLQTTPGKFLTTFQRWKLIDTAMMYNAAKDAFKYLKKGQAKKASKELAKLARAAAFYYFAGALATDLARAGHDKLAKIMKTGQEPVNVIKDPDAWLSIADGANADLIMQIVNTLRVGSYKLGLSDRPYGYDKMETLRDAYLSPWATLEEFGLIEPRRPKKLGKYLYEMKSPQERLNVLRRVKKYHPELYNSTVRYYKWYKLGLTDEEQDLYYIRDEKEKLKLAYRYLKKLSPTDRKKALLRMRKARVLSQKQKLKIIRLLKNS